MRMLALLRSVSREHVAACAAVCAAACAAACVATCNRLDISTGWVVPGMCPGGMRTGGGWYMVGREGTEGQCPR